MYHTCEGAFLQRGVAQLRHIKAVEILQQQQLLVEIHRFPLRSCGRDANYNIIHIPCDASFIVGCPRAPLIDATYFIPEQHLAARENRFCIFHAEHILTHSSSSINNWGQFIAQTYRVSAPEQKGTANTHSNREKEWLVWHKHRKVYYSRRAHIHTFKFS